MLVDIVMVERAEGKLAEMALALAATSRLARRLDRRQQQGHQNADDRDHDQEFDQSKTILTGVPSMPHG
jgi:hypothetical protein